MSRLPEDVQTPAGEGAHHPLRYLFVQDGAVLAPQHQGGALHPGEGLPQVVYLHDGRLSGDIGQAAVIAVGVGAVLVLHQGVLDEAAQGGAVQGRPLLLEEAPRLFVGEGRGRAVHLGSHVLLEAHRSPAGHLGAHVHQHQVAQALPVLAGVGHGATGAQGEAHQVEALQADGPDEGGQVQGIGPDQVAARGVLALAVAPLAVGPDVELVQHAVGEVLPVVGVVPQAVEKDEGPLPPPFPFEVVDAQTVELQFTFLRLDQRFHRLLPRRLSVGAGYLAAPVSSGNWENWMSTPPESLGWMKVSATPSGRRWMPPHGSMPKARIASAVRSMSCT